MKIRNGDKATWVRRSGERLPVRVMVRADGYAMVRRHGVAMPMVCPENELVLGGWVRKTSGNKT